MEELNPLPLPDGVTSRMVSKVNGLNIHVLEAGDPTRPAILLLHGFPELAFSWRKIMLPLADLGYHVIAPDQRGYGRTTGWVSGFDEDLFTSRMPNLVRDAMGLLFRMGHDHAEHVLGHDFGASVAGWAGVLRPDIFRSITVMSAPFATPAAAVIGAGDYPEDRIDEELAALARPRKHYQHYYSTREANSDMLNASVGLKEFLRAYFHMKGAGWIENTPLKLQGWTGDALAQMPTYYIMDRDHTMPQAVLPASSASEDDWMSDKVLNVYSAEYARTGFQGALNWYRCRFVSEYVRELGLAAGTKIKAPMTFIAGAQDWGVRQTPGALEDMEARASEDWRGTYLIDQAGHWVQQEQSAEVVNAWRQAMKI